MGMLDRFKRKPQPIGRTTRVTRRRRDGQVDRGYTDTTGAFFLLDGSVPDSSDYSELPQVDDSRPDSNPAGDYGYVGGPDRTPAADPDRSQHGGYAAGVPDSGWASGWYSSPPAERDSGYAAPADRDTGGYSSGGSDSGGYSSGGSDSGGGYSSSD